MLSLTQNGVPTTSIRSFISRISFDRLGAQAEADQVGIATLRTLLELLGKNGAPGSSVRSFCSKMNFERVGAQAEADQVGIATLKRLLEILNKYEVPREVIIQFFSELRMYTVVSTAVVSEVGPEVFSRFINLVFFLKLKSYIEIDSIWTMFLKKLTPIKSLIYIKNHSRFWIYDAFKKHLRNSTLAQELSNPRPNLLKDLSFIFYQINGTKFVYIESFLALQDLENIAFEKCLELSTISELAYFVFNFNYSQKLAHLSEFYIQKIDHCSDIILSIMELPKTELSGIDIFLWNLFLNCPSPTVLKIYSDPGLKREIASKYLYAKDPEVLLAIIGVLSYVSVDVEELLELVEAEGINSLKIERILQENPVTSLRVLAGLYQVDQERFRLLYTKLDQENFTLLLDLPKQETFRKKLKEYYDSL